MKNFKEYMKMYDYDYLIELLHRTIYEYAIMDGYDENDIDDDYIWDFLYNNLLKNENNQKKSV